MLPRLPNWEGAGRNWVFAGRKPFGIVARGMMARAPICRAHCTARSRCGFFEAACIRVCPEQAQPA